MNPAVEISFSRVQSYVRCPWLYNLVYNEGWRAGPSAPAALGQSLHRTLADYLSPDNTERTLDRLFEIFDSLWVNEGFSSTQQALEAYERGRGMLEHFFQSDRDRQSEVLYAEREFILDLDGVKFRGTVDRLDRAPDGTYEIVEYKTNDQHWTDERIANDLQMTLYQIGVSEAWELAPVRLKYLFLSSGRVATAERTAQQLDDAKHLLIETSEKIGKKLFLPNHRSCARCEFGKRCVNFREGTIQ